MFTLKTLIYLVAFLVIIFFFAKFSNNITQLSKNIYQKSDEKFDAIKCSFLMQQSHYNLTQPNQGFNFKCSKSSNKILSLNKNEYSLLVTPEAVNDDLANIGASKNGHYK